MSRGYSGSGSADVIDLTSQMMVGWNRLAYRQAAPDIVASVASGRQLVMGGRLP
jgi:hypothetical protein